MGIAELINKEKKTAFSFEVLPPLKGTGIEILYATIDTLREFDPLYVNITTHKPECLDFQGLSDLVLLSHNNP